MPADKVQGIQLVTEVSTNEMADARKIGVPVAEVRWNREGGYVQLVTKEEDAFGGRLMGEEVGLHYTDGMYVDLDRTGINKLIRSLRRARDQAFGRDE